MIRFCGIVVLVFCAILYLRLFYKWFYILGLEFVVIIVIVDSYSVVYLGVIVCDTLEFRFWS